MFLTRGHQKKERSIYLTCRGENQQQQRPYWSELGRAPEVVGGGGAFDREPVLPSNEAIRLGNGPVMGYQRQSDRTTGLCYRFRKNMFITSYCPQVFVPTSSTASSSRSDELPSKVISSLVLGTPIFRGEPEIHQVAVRRHNRTRL